MTIIVVHIVNKGSGTVGAKRGCDCQQSQNLAASLVRHYQSPLCDRNRIGRKERNNIKCDFQEKYVFRQKMKIGFPLPNRGG